MRIRTLIAVTLLGTGLVLALQGGWIQAKAAVAQLLLADAWARTLADGGRHRPWPWADHWPVARLRLDRLGIDQVVLHGDSGAVLAFAPGLNPRSALPPASGPVVISGHRDTHFRALEQIRRGDVVELSTAQGTTRYRIAATRVVDARTAGIDITTGAPALYLVTCYPFDALSTGGPLRFVATGFAMI